MPPPARDYSRCHNAALNDIFLILRGEPTLAPMKRQRFLTALVDADYAHRDLETTRADLDEAHRLIGDVLERATRAEAALETANDRLSEAGYPPVPNPNAANGAPRHADSRGSDRTSEGHPGGDGGEPDRAESGRGVAASRAGSDRRAGGGAGGKARGTAKAPA